MSYLPRKRLPAIAVLAMAGSLAYVPAPALAHGDETAHREADGGSVDGAIEHEAAEVRLEMPMMNAERGMRLFVDKGCVACHAVNGVGGHDAVPLDAHSMTPVMNPFDLAAKMWRVAPYMIAAQEEAFGYQITFTGAELADIVAFLHDDAQQHQLSDAMLGPEVLEMMDHRHGGAGGAAAHAEEVGHDAGHHDGGAHD